VNTTLETLLLPSFGKERFSNFHHLTSKKITIRPSSHPSIKKERASFIPSTNQSQDEEALPRIFLAIMLCVLIIIFHFTCRVYDYHRPDFEEQI
jgi:hypothetical protein